jgi:hypothetical protein
MALLEVHDGINTGRSEATVLYCANTGSQKPIRRLDFCLPNREVINRRAATTRC